MLDHMVGAQQQHALDSDWKRPPWDGIKQQESEDSALHAQLYKAAVVELHKWRHKSLDSK